MIETIKQWVLDPHNKKGLFALAAIIVLVFIFSGQSGESKLWRFIVSVGVIGLGFFAFSLSKLT